MLIPREVAEDAQEYQKLMEAANQARAEVIDWLDKNTGTTGVYVGDLFIADHPKGEPMSAEADYTEKIRNLSIYQATGTTPLPYIKHEYIVRLLILNSVKSASGDFITCLKRSRFLQYHKNLLDFPWVAEFFRCTMSSTTRQHHHAKPLYRVQWFSSRVSILVWNEYVLPHLRSSTQAVFAPELSTAAAISLARTNLRGEFCKIFSYSACIRRIAKKFAAIYNPLVATRLRTIFSK